ADRRMLTSCSVQFVLAVHFFFFIVMRPPPQSTLFPYNDALPISCIGFAPGAKGSPALRPSGVFPVFLPYTTFDVIVNTLIVCSRSEEHTSELQSRFDLVCRLLLEKKKHA